MFPGPLKSLLQQFIEVVLQIYHRLRVHRDHNCFFDTIDVKKYDKLCSKIDEIYSKGNDPNPERVWIDRIVAGKVSELYCTICSIFILYMTLLSSNRLKILTILTQKTPNSKFLKYWPITLTLCYHFEYHCWNKKAIPTNINFPVEKHSLKGMMNLTKISIGINIDAR